MKLAEHKQQFKNNVKEKVEALILKSLPVAFKKIEKNNK